MRFKSREEKLRYKIIEELKKESPNTDRFAKIFEEFEKDNINTISKLKKVKKVTIKKISGALRQSINAHGPITKNLIGSATKRIYGSLLELEEDKETTSKNKVIELIFALLVLLILFMYFSCIIIYYLFFLNTNGH